MPDRFRRRALLASTIAALSCAPATLPPAPPPSAPAALPEVHAAWLGLPSTRNGCSEHYDYFPQGGLAIFYCHARSLLPLERLEQLSGMRATREPPAGPLGRAFRHYDPRFVEWLRGALLPARSDARFRERTQAVYDRYVAPLARQLLATRRLLTGRRDWTQGEVRWVREQLERGALPERWYAERYETLGDEALEPSGWDVNVGPNAVAFWIRRELDGSAPTFAAALEELVSLYDGAWLRAGAAVVGTARVKDPPPSAAAPAETIAVAQLWRDRQRLARRVVQVQGKVMKFDAGIMGRNWLHLRDGTGSQSTRDHDLTVTTSDTVDVGEVVTIEGTVSVDRDFGAGYAYPLMLESARILRSGPGTPTSPGATDALGGPGGQEEGAPVNEGAAPASCGTVKEVLPNPPYAYLRVLFPDGEKWLALPARSFAVAERICARDLMPMPDFDSRALKRRFPLVYFGQEAK